MAPNVQSLPAVVHSLLLGLFRQQFPSGLEDPAVLDDEDGVEHGEEGGEHPEGKVVDEAQVVPDDAAERQAGQEPHRPQRVHDADPLRAVLLRGGVGNVCIAASKLIVICYYNLQMMQFT